MNRTASARMGLAFTAICTLATVAGAYALGAGASPAALSLAGGFGPAATAQRFGGGSSFLSESTIVALKHAARNSSARSLFRRGRDVTGDTGSGPGPLHQKPRDLDLTFADQTGAVTPTAPTKANPGPPYTDIEPSYGVDLHTLYFASNRPVGSATTGSGYHLFSMELDGGYQQQIALPATTIIAGTANTLNLVATDQEWPSESSDGNFLAYSARDANGVAQIHYLNLQTGSDTQVTSGPGDKLHPTWSGTLLTFQDNETTPANPTGLWKIWIADAANGIRAQLTGLGNDTAQNAGVAGANDTEPSWEPNGNHIAFTRQSASGKRIWLATDISFNEAAPLASAAYFTQFTNFVTASGQPSQDQDPAWEPETTVTADTVLQRPQIAFASTRKTDPRTRQMSVGGTYGIYAATVSNGTNQPLTEQNTFVIAEDSMHRPFTYDNIQPSWSPATEVDPITGFTHALNRVAYASNSGIPYSTATQQYVAPMPNFDIWTSEIVDYTPPALEAVPTVSPRVSGPGQTVTIKAQIADLNAGVARVFAQIKNPNSHFQDLNLPDMRSGPNFGTATYDTNVAFPDNGFLPCPATPRYPLGIFNDLKDPSAIHTVLDGHRIYAIRNIRLPWWTNTQVKFIDQIFYHSVYEIGYQPINPDAAAGTDPYADNGQENLPLDVTDTYYTQGLLRYNATDLNNPSWKPKDTLELTRSTDPNDPPDTYVGTWVTDSHPTDYYVDIIAADSVGNAIDYDNVGGFSTKTFLPQNSILLVQDYASPQQFVYGYGGRDVDTRFGMECWLTDNPVGRAPANWIAPRVIPENPDNITIMNTVYSPPDIDYTNFSCPSMPPKINRPPRWSYLVGDCNTLGLGSWINTLESGLFGVLPANGQQNPGAGQWPVRTSYYNPAYNYDGYDIYRVLCRGPISPAVLNTYGPTISNEPDANLNIVPTKYNSRCVVWASPYTNDEFVGPGTIADRNMQAVISQYVSNGGHIFLTGQDIAWALSLNNPSSQSDAAAFLKNNFAVQFKSDGVLTRGDAITASAGSSNTTIGGRWSPPDSPQIPLGPIFDPSGIVSLDEYRIHDTYTQIGGLDQAFPDLLTAVTGPANSVVNTDYSQDGSADLISTVDPNTYNLRTVFAGFGIEGLDEQLLKISYTPGTGGGGGGPRSKGPTTRQGGPGGGGGGGGAVEVLQYTDVDQQQKLMHGIVCALRQHSAQGVVNANEPGGQLAPIPNALLIARNTGTGAIVARALTRSDGTFTLNGIPSGGGLGGDLVDLYPQYVAFEINTIGAPVSPSLSEGAAGTSITASRPGYAVVHLAPESVAHAGQQTYHQELLGVAPAGAIDGLIVDANTGLPVPGATIKIINVPFKDIDLLAVNSSSTEQRDANGNLYNFFRDKVPSNPPNPLTGAPDSSYVVTITAPGYAPLIVGAVSGSSNPTPIVVNSGATVNLGTLKLTPAQATVKGVVVDPNGKPVSGAVVTATPKNLTTGPVQVKTDANGAYTFTLAPDTYTFQATAAGYAPSKPISQAIPAPVNTGDVVTLANLVLVSTQGQKGTDSISGTVAVSYLGNTIPQANVTIQLTDLTGDILQTTSTNANGAYQFTGLFDGTYQVAPVLPGRNIQPKQVTTSSTVNGGAVTGVNFTLSPITVFPMGYSMISLPYSFSGTNADVAQLLGTQSIADWNASTNNYEVYPRLNGAIPGASGTQTAPGYGYWIRESSSTALLSGGNPITSPTYDVVLLPGWNIVGDPYTSAVALNLVQVKAPFAIGSTPANSPITMAQAQASHIINSPLYTWSGSSYTTSTTLQPFVGYWIYIDPTASKGLPITLTFTKPSP